MKLDIEIIIQILGVLSPYIVLVVTLLVQDIKTKKREVPIIRCFFEKYPADNVRAVILNISNSSNFSAFDVNITPELELWGEDYVSTRTDILFSGDAVKFIFYEQKEYTPVTVSYRDQYNKQHRVEYLIKAVEYGEYVSDFRVDVKTNIIK